MPRPDSIHARTVARAVPPSFATTAVRAGRQPDHDGALTAPICQATAFLQDGLGRPRQHTYARASNPTVARLEEALGALDGAPPSVCFASGMAALTTLLLATVTAGDEVVAGLAVYGGTARLLQRVLAPLGIRAAFVDTGDLAAVERALARRPRLLLVETPGNPTLRLTDIGAVAALARRAGTLLAVDNTFLTPLLVRPLDLGADVAVYSTTKYLEGHNATVGGALTARDPALLERLRFLRKAIGNIQAPFSAWLTLRGLDTLPLRVRAHSRHAQAVAEWLAAQPAVAGVAYPGLAGFPQAELARGQHRDAETAEPLHGGIVAFTLRGGAAAATRFTEALRLVLLAENLGTTQTLLTHPASMTHADVEAAQRRAAGIGDDLLRLSVGLEHPRDLIADLAQALAASGEGAPRRRGEVAHG